MPRGSHEVAFAQISSWAAGAPILRTSRLVLEEPRPSDAEPLWRYLSSEEVSRMMAQPPATPDGFLRFFEWASRERAAGRCLCYVIRPAGSDEPAGLIQARAIETGFGSAEWGFGIGRPFWGTGIFVDAATALADYLFRHLGVDRLEARVAVPNERAANALMKLGAVSEGMLRGAFERQDTRYDQMLWTIARDTWLSRTTGPAVSVEPARVGGHTTAPGVPRHPGKATSMPRVLAGTECTLRALLETDAPELTRLLSTSAVARHFPPPPKDLPAFRQFIRWTEQQRDSGRSYVFGAVPPGAEHAVGLFQLHALHPGLGVAEWGFALGEQYWGSGLFLEGARLMMRFAFDTLGIRRLEARASVDNGRANGALLKVGGTPECRLRRSFLFEDASQDDMLWSILDDEWRRRASNALPGDRDLTP